MFLDKQFINYELRINRLRRSILYVVVAMALLGALLVYDASSVYSWFKFSDTMHFFKRQIFFIAAGLLSLFFVLMFNIDSLRKYSKLSIIFGIWLLISVLIFGTKVYGARRWFRVFGFGFQPSEFMKLFFLFYLADYFARKQTVIKSFSKGALPALLVTGLISFLVFLEPDFGNAIFFGATLLVFLFISKVPRKYLLTLVLIGFVLFSILIIASPYRRARIFSYINPWADSQGAGFQLAQSQIGVGSGGLMGLGIGESRQKLFFLPAAHTDFIYSIIAEELGLLGSMLVLFFYVFIFIQGLRILRWVENPFHFYLGWGALFIIIFQAFINISVVLGILPTKGLPLPFISYGGSSTLVSFLLLGLFLNATKEA